VEAVTLTDFLLARIAEREERARRAGAEAWQHRSIYRRPDSPQSIYRAGEEIATVSHLHGPHIATWNPARVLAECEAHRKILAALDMTPCPCQTADRCVIHDASTASVAVERYVDPVTEATLHALVLLDADHPDYREEWKP
jgi:hypothetical protein